MADFHLKTATPNQWNEIAELIRASTNRWYENEGKTGPFQCDATDVQIFCKIYEDLDPQSCLLAIDASNGKIAASCFYHPRESHVSLGIMNVHPDYYGHGLANRLLKKIIAISEDLKRPLRLISSAMNLDSFSLYNKNAFVPTETFQDMLMPVPEQGFDIPTEEQSHLRKAELQDVDTMHQLEKDLLGLSRRQDLEYFVRNEPQLWETFVYTNDEGVCEGYLNSIYHPASKMLGPGVMKTERACIALILKVLNQYPGKTLVLLAPSQFPNIIQKMYSIGGRNCEIHFTQVRGQAFENKGIMIPTFLPESA